MESKFLSILVFGAVYALAATEVLNKAVATLLGVMALLIVGVADVHTAAGYIRLFIAKSLDCLGLAILLFVTQTFTKITPGLVALSIAMLLFVITRILEQHFVRIKQLIRDLAANGIEHLVIPEYNLSHFLDIVNKLFLGATSVTPDRNVATTVGSANIVGLCHLNRIPVYLRINSLKFAYKSIAEQEIYKADQKHSRENLTDMQTTFSHDMVDFDLIDHVITEEGEISVR
jgi:hypothetical protein